MVSDLKDTLATLQTGDFQARWEMVKVLSTWGEAAIAPLIQLLQAQNSDLELQWFIARVLGEYHHPDAVMALVRVLQQSEDEDLRLAATQALGQMGGEAISELSPLLASPDTQLRAVQALAQMRTDQVIPALISVANAANLEVRMTALEALGRYTDARIPPLLQQALHDPNPQVRQIAVTNLSYHHEEIDDSDIVQLVQPLLQDADLQVAQRTAMALGRFRTDAALAALLACVHAPEMACELKIKGVQALGWSQHPSAVKALHQVLMGEIRDTLTGEIVQEILMVVGRISDPMLKPEATQLLLEFLASQASILDLPPLKRTLISALGQLGDVAAVPELIQLLATPDLAIRFHVIAALKQISPDLTYAHLQTLTAQSQLDSALADGIAIALREW
jgi:HEAT repeat protein